MRLKTLKMRNWCQHESRDVAFGGMTQIRGPNGSGKSNLLNAVVYALTGVIRSAGVNADNVRHGADSSSVELAFEAGGVDCSVSRSPAGGKEWCEIGGQKTTGHAKVNKTIEAFLADQVGGDLVGVLEHVFVPQWGMFSFLSQKDAQREASFASLFGMEKLEKIWETLRDVSLPSPASLSVDPEYLRASVAKADAAVAEVTQRIRDLKSRLSVSSPMVDGWNATVEKHRAFQAASLRRAELERAIAGATSSLESINNLVASKDAAVAEIRVEVDKLRAAAAEDATITAAWASFNEYRDRQARRLSGIASMEAGLASLDRTQAPVKPDGYVDSEHWQSSYESLERMVLTFDTINRLLSSFDGDKAACPTCHTKVSSPDLAERLQKAEAAKPVVAKQLSDLRRSLEESRSYDAKLAIYSRQRAAMVAELESSRKELASIQPVPEPHRPPPLEDLSFRLTLRERARTELEQALKAAEIAQAGSLARAVALEKDLASLDADKVESVSEVEAAAAADSLRKHQADLSQLSQENAVASIAADRLLEYRQQLAKAEESVEQHRRVASARAGVEKVRTVFHRSGFPKFAMSRYFVELKDRVNQILSSFEIATNPFLLESAEGARFTVKLATGRVVAATRLSGGQQMLLALACRVAVNLMFASSLGLICLDEPTVGLDADNLGCLKDALVSLQDMSRSNGLQVIVVTHSPELDYLFDKTVLLS